MIDLGIGLGVSDFEIILGVSKHIYICIRFDVKLCCYDNMSHGILCDLIHYQHIFHDI